MGTKTVHRLQLPYAVPEWPTISKDVESSIVQTLVDILQPIGEYRKRHVIPSKGRHRNKRKRDNQAVASDVTRNNSVDQNRMPSVFDHITVGFNSTVRSLEGTSQHSKPASLRAVDSHLEDSADVGLRLGAVFVCRSVLPDAVTASIPLMIATASRAQLEEPPIRLVQLSGSAEIKLAEALHQPRVGFIGVRFDAPGVDVLLAIVQAAVDPLQVPWLDGSKNINYFPVQIESTETLTRVKGKPKKPATQLPPSTKEKSEKAGL